MKIAREARLALKGIRVEVEHTRKRLKEDSLRTGQTIDAIAKILTNEIAPIEKYLEEQEKFAENQEKARKALLRSARESALIPYAVETQHYNLEEMSDESFDALLKASAIAFQEKQAAIAKAEADRIAQEKAEAEAREAQRQENERLKAEAEAMRKEKEEAEKLARQERERLEAQAKAAEQEAQKERIAREKIERERADKEAAEKAAQEKAEKERLKAEKAEKSRPDREKLLAFAAEIEALAAKDLGLTGEEYVGLLEESRRSLQNISNTLIGETNAL
ncbi:MAG: hypothetical protein ACOVSW_22875 [Candidatus Kapaibacteriota bacterium]